MIKQAVRLENQVQFLESLESIVRSSFVLEPYLPIGLADGFVVPKSEKLSNLKHLVLVENILDS